MLSGTVAIALVASALVFRGNEHLNWTILMLPLSQGTKRHNRCRV